MIRYFLLLLAFLSSQSVIAKSDIKHPWFIGAGVGYGSTVWQGLVPEAGKQNMALSLSTPLDVDEGGVLWGFGGGVEVISQFQLEFFYWKYPNSTIYFDKDSLFSFENNNATNFRTSTYTYLLDGKFLVPWKDTNFNIYATAGLAWLNRDDYVFKNEIISPSFGVGVNYGFDEHWMGEFGFVYTAGNGESELNPALDYMPFLYGIYTRVFYRFG
jgi:hypothetical protein